MKSQRRVIVLALGLVLLLGGAAWAYRALAPAANATSGLAAVAAGARGDGAQTAAGQGAADGSASATSAVASQAPAADAVMLADHNATVYTREGEPLQLSALAQGKPLVINFWATWCPYCVDELPDFQKIVADFGDRVSFAFVDVVDGRRERAEDAQAWLDNNGFSGLPDYYDTKQEAVTTFGVYSYPTTVVVSATGEVLTVTPGRIDASLMRGALNTLVGE